MKYIENRTKVEDLKIAYIGGGSRGWARKLMSDLALEPAMSGQVYLYDIDRDAVKANEIIGNMYSAKEEAVIIPDTEPKVRIVAENGKIFFESAECEDKLCVSCGKLEKKGDTAVCLPSKTVITVAGSDVDAVTY